MFATVEIPQAGKAAIYSGVFWPHWEIGHIRIRVARKGRVLPVATCLLGVAVLWWFGFLTILGVAVLSSLVIALAASPAYERWSPRFPEGFFKSSVDELSDDLYGNSYMVVFEGIATERGWYGHKGIMHRKVQILRVLKWKRI